MWDAVVSNDGAFDGVFYYAVLTTRIICRPSCRSKAPRRENVVFFRDLKTALAEGFRPCKRCRPDLGQEFHPELDWVAAAKSILESECSDPAVLSGLPARINISLTHLERLFKKNTGLTLKRYLLCVRIEKARILLKKPGHNNTDVCFDVGFSSLSNFYTEFRRQTGMTPGEYRSR
jgi:AraC family transcriptional regulator of adaptative response / methylphosphotriester-DNA alkyltransferase methyltransferase